MASLEELLDRVRCFTPGQGARDLVVDVPHQLTWRAAPVSADVAMAILLDALLAKNLFPAGVTEMGDFRRYAYRHEP